MEEQGRNKKGQFISFEETKVQTAKDITEQKDNIQEGQNTLKLAQLLMDERRTRSVGDIGGKKTNETAKQFATLNNTFGILSKTLGEYTSIGQTQIDVVNELKDITEKAEFASAKDQKQMLREVGTQIKILKEVEGQTDPDTSPVLKEALKTQELLRKNSGIMDQMNQGLSSVLVKGFGALTGALGDSPILAMGAQFVGNKITERSERKREEAGKLRSAVRKKQDTEQDTLVDQTLSTDDAKDFVSKTKAEKSEFGDESDISPEILREAVYAGVTDGMRDALTEAIVIEPDEAIKEELQDILDSLADADGVIEAVNRVEARMEEANVEAIRQYNRNRRDAIEARRDAKASVLTHSDGFGSEEGDLKKKAGGFLQALKDRFVITGLGISALIGSVFGKKGFLRTSFVKLFGKDSILRKGLTRVGKGLKLLLNTKAVQFLLKKALPIAAMGYALFKGGQAAIESYKKDGDILKATGAFFGQIAETLTFGLLKKEQLSEWGSQLGMWIEEKLTLLGEKLKRVFIEPFDAMREMFTKIGTWLSDIFDVDIRKFFNPTIIKFLEKAGVIDTLQEKDDKELAKQFDEEAKADIRTRIAAQNMTEKDADDMIAERENKIEIEAKNADITVVQYKARQQQHILDKPSDAPEAATESTSPTPVIEVPDARTGDPAVSPVPVSTQSPTIEITAPEQSNGWPAVVAAMKERDSQTTKLKMVEDRSLEIEKSNARKVEASGEKAKQPHILQQNSSVSNNTNLTIGGPSDDDNMRNRSEKSQRPG